MKLKWIQSPPTVVIQYLDGTQFECPGIVWSRIGNTIGDGIFTTINAYWASLPIERQQYIDDLYRRMMGCFTEVSNTATVNRNLKPLAEELMGTFDWTYFKLWCKLNGNLFLGNGIKDTLDDKDKEGLTYYTQDYEDLLIFSIMLKAIMPMWGWYHHELSDSIGKFYIHIEAVEMIRSAYVNSLPPIQKLEDYIECFTDIKIKKPGFSLKSGVGTEEISKYLISLALIKKVCIFNPQDQDGSIVKNVYHLLLERCNEITKNKPNEKKDTDNDGADLSIADRYKIVQRIPPGVTTMLEYSLRDPYVIASKLDPTVPTELVRKYVDKVTNSHEILDYHLTIMAVAANRIIAGRSLQVVPYTAIVNCIRAVSAVLEHWDFLEIAEVLSTQPQKKDYLIMSSTLMGNRSYSHLRPDMVQELTNLYPFVFNNKNPGIALIDDIIKDVLKFDWKVKSDNFNDLRNSIARLLLKELGGKQYAVSTGD